MEDYRAVNRASWDERVPAHAESPDYALARFAEDPSFLSGVVRFDLPRLGDVAGLDVVHLQCHIGTDTVSLPGSAPGSPGWTSAAAAVEQGRAFAAEPGPGRPVRRVRRHDAVQALGGSRFDLVYTGVGALCWLPDIDRWAGVVAALLRPGGRLFLREGHPVLWSIDETRADGLLVVEHPYFERDEPLVWDDGGTYVQTDRTFTRNVTHEWNHGLGEIVTALHRHGLALTMLVEHDSAPWDALPGTMTEVAPNEWQLTEHPDELAPVHAAGRPQLTTWHWPCEG